MISILPILSLAQGGGAGNVPGGGSLNPLGGTDTLAQFIANILKVAITIALPITALAIVYVGFLFVTAKGNPGDINKAKEALQWTLVGLAILLGAQAIVSIIKTTVTGLGD
ncbi:TPA: hypothetical protein DDZ75_03580 [Patescibacteria group bacterium]|nr:hypothetical protein [Patescibacteria group bacterium]